MSGCVWGGERLVSYQVQMNAMIDFYKKRLQARPDRLQMCASDENWPNEEMGRAGLQWAFGTIFGLGHA